MEDILVNKKKILDRRFFPAGTMVIEQGSSGNCAYLIERGRVEVFTKDSGGHEVRLAEMGEKALIGEMALLADGPRSANVRTMEDTVLIVISPHELHRAIDASENLFQRLTNMVISRAKDTHQKLLQKELSETEKTAQESIKHLTQDAALHKRNILKKELSPLLERIKSTLGKPDKD